MDDKMTSGLILLTYKGKVLLMCKNKSAIDLDEPEWSFIGGKKNDHEAFEQTISKNVEKETSIKIQEIEFISNNCYHARLTDENVNNIKRDELQLLNFFTLNEVQKLTLSTPTKTFILKYGDLIQTPTDKNSQPQMRNY